MFNLKLKDPTVYLPTTLPFNKTDEGNDTENISQEFYNENDTLNEKDFFLIQMPRLLPMDIESQNKSKKEEIENEYEYEQGGASNKGNKLDFESSFKLIPPNSKLGKLKFYKSGKVKLLIGKNLFDITSGVDCQFAQELAVVSAETCEAYFLGKIREKKLIVTPELNL